MKSTSIDAFAELEKELYGALETYSNIHRGNGYNSIETTRLYEESRLTVLDYLGLERKKYTVVFCTPYRAAYLQAHLEPDSYKIISCRENDLPFGLKAVAAERKSLSKIKSGHFGGGTARLVSPDWIIWSGTPDRFEAGTPPIINVIAFSKALEKIKKSGRSLLNKEFSEILTADDILYSDEFENYSGSELLEKLRGVYIGRDKLVPTSSGPKPYINLDNGASTPTFEPVWNSVRHTWRQPVKVQYEIISKVRSICLEFLGASENSYDLIFTSNATESINILAENLGKKFEEDNENVILNTILEHNSNDLPWRMHPTLSLIRLTADHEGFLNLKELEKLLEDYNRKNTHGKKRIRLVTVSGASNVLGTFNDLEKISTIVHNAGAMLMVDAAQMVAHRKVETGKLDIDFLAFSAHKVYAPFGTGVLIAKKGILNFGLEEYELIKSSGEENAGGIAALGKALILLNRIGFEAIRNEEQKLTRKLLNGMSVIPKVKIYGIMDPGSPGFEHKGGVIPFVIKNMIAAKSADILSEKYGIGVRSGCHCAHILVKYLVGISPFLERFQGLLVRTFSKLNLPGIVRVSLGMENTEKDVDYFLDALRTMAGKSK